MKITELRLPGLKLIELDIHGDARGFFTECYHRGKLAELGFKEEFVQDNHARSAPKTLRGLHYQVDPRQGKLVSVFRGKIFDAVVDIRPDSPTFGESFSIELDDVSGRLLWVPSGFAHGYCVLGDEATDLFYKVTGFYNPRTEGGILWNDPGLRIAWPVTDPIVSRRDANNPRLKDINTESLRKL